jgi:hypothetical protein
MQQLQLPLLSEAELHGVDTARMFEDEDEMRARTPALFAVNPHPKMSSRYSFTNTYDILRHVHNRGFRVSSVQGGHKSYNTVMVRMRHKGYDVRDEAPEIVVIDSHDGSKRLKLMLGMIRFICMNGCVAGDMMYAKSFIHLAPDLMEQVILELEDIEQHIVRLEKRVDAMKSYITSYGERAALADVATYERFGNERPAAFVADMRPHLLEVRRDEDTSMDMYTVMNVIQENVLRGGMFYFVNRTYRRMTPINNVTRNVNINQRLWREAEGLVARGGISNTHQ